MDIVLPLILALLQGMTEFLPVSSSGHLILLNNLFSTDLGIAFDITLHLATLVSVCIFYRKQIASICIGCCKELNQKEKPNLKLLGALILATAITGTIGLALNDYVESQLRSVLVVGVLLIVNAAILWSSQKHARFKLTNGNLNWKTAAVIGLVQGLAVLPGISRSGSTITAALLLGVKPDQCAGISFLLSIPVILGAVFLHLGDLNTASPVSLPLTAAAFVVAAVVGFFCLLLLDKILKKAAFHKFAPYCLCVGIAAIVAYFTFLN